MLGDHGDFLGPHTGPLVASPGVRRPSDMAGDPNEPQATRLWSPRDQQLSLVGNSACEAGAFLGSCVVDQKEEIVPSSDTPVLLDG